MANMTADHSETIRDLGDGLIIRRATMADVEALVEFDSRVHSDDGWDEPFAPLGTWVRDLLIKPHPTFGMSNFTVVQDTRTGKIVSSQSLILQTWSYGGIEFGVGKPELIGTHPDYRMRGLTRAQLEVIHQWCVERNLVVQVIAGIPWFYRRFGYEMALDLGGGRTAYAANIPKLGSDAEERYRARPATLTDLRFIAEVYDAGRERGLVSCIRNQAQWRYELEGRSAGGLATQRLVILETTGGKPVGFLACSERLWRGALEVAAWELQPGVSWLEVVPSVLRHLTTIGKECAARDERNDFEALNLNLGNEHPVYEIARDRLPLVHRPYAWYVRVPKLSAFLRRVSPVLDQRLARSPVAGHTGELTISFYRDGVRLVLEKGRIASVGSWRPEEGGRAGARFPGLTFLQLLFGYRSFDELDYAFADCSASHEARPLVEALFRKQSSNVWSIA